MSILFFHQKPGVFLNNRKQLKQFILSIFSDQSQRVETVNFIFCSDEFLLKINKDFLNHDYYTDIITFNTSHKHQPVCSDIYISIDRVKDNAKKLGLTYKSELHRVIFHGILHLCGFNDKTPKQAGNMRFMEDTYLNKYFKRST